MKVDGINVIYKNLAKNIARTLKVDKLLDEERYLSVRLYHIGACIEIL
jgi:hypothetical protein